MQTDNRFLDGMAKFLTNAAGAAQAFKSEMETMMKGRIEKMIADLDFVPRGRVRRRQGDGGQGPHRE